jgi:hypothetical protein
MPEIYCEECRAWSAAYDQILDVGNKSLPPNAKDQVADE